MPAPLRSTLGESVLTAADLLERLGVSAPTLSRRVAASGADVVRMGRGRSTRYAATRQVAGVTSPLPLRRISTSGAPVELGALHPLAGRGHLLRFDANGEVLYQGLPPFVDDMRPQGFLGRRFAELHTDLELPSRHQDWSADQILRALCSRGDDAVGDLILGEDAFNRWLSAEVVETARDAYPLRARAAAMGEAGSSAGGEHPKFTAFNRGRHVLVKFADRDDGGLVTRRWRDLLVCEAIALEVLRGTKVPAPQASWFDVDGQRFLEVERFDRQGARGRRGVVSLGAWANEFLGDHRSWTTAVAEMVARSELSAQDARIARWLDVFGQLIANSDRHFWNLSFFWDLKSAPALAPAYDMLPMWFAPGATGVIDRPYQPAPPTADTLDVWAQAAASAEAYWQRVTGEDALSDGFRRLAAGCLALLQKKRRELAHLTPS